MSQARFEYKNAQKRGFFAPGDSGLSGGLPAVTKKALSSILLLLFIFLTFPHSSWAGPQSSTYELKEYGFGAGGIASASSTTYSLFGVAGEQDIASASSTTYGLQAGLTFTMQGGTPPAPTVSNPGSNYDRLMIAVNTGGNPGDTRYAIAISDDNWTTTKFVKSDYTLGTTLTSSDWLLYAGGQGIGWGGAGGFYVTGLKNNTTYRIRVKAMQGVFTETRWSNDASVATVDPSLTFTINSEIGGQIGHYAMDESSWNGTAGEIIDSSGAGNNGTAMPNAPFTGPSTTTGKFGRAGSFDGNNDYVDLGDNSALHMSDSTSMTFASWLRVTAINIGGAMKVFRYDSCDSLFGSVCTRSLYSLNIEANGSFNFFFGNSATGLSGVTTGVDTVPVGGTWVHVAAVRDTSSHKAYLYINGQLANSADDTTTGTWTTTGARLLLGRYSNTPFYNGLMDEVRIYNRALTPAQINDLYNASPNLSSNLYFNNLNAGNSFTDSSKTTVMTTSTNAYNGYIVYGYETGALANTNDATKTIGNYAGTNSIPTSWTGTGFGYTTNDSSLTGGTANRFTNGGPNYAGFTATAPGDPVADHAGPVTSPISNEQFTVSYRVTAPTNTTAGTYKTQVIYIVTPTY